MLPELTVQQWAGIAAALAGVWFSRGWLKEQAAKLLPAKAQNGTTVTLADASAGIMTAVAYAHQNHNAALAACLGDAAKALASIPGTEKATWVTTAYVTPRPPEAEGGAAVTWAKPPQPTGGTSAASGQ